MAPDPTSVLPPATRAIVTGGGTGIGRRAALALAATGVAVGLIGRRREPLAAVAAEITARGGCAHVAVADVAVPTDMRLAVADLVEQLGGLDLVVVNAGAIESEQAPWAESDLDDAIGVVRACLIGAMVTTRTCLDHMPGGGRIMTTNSGFAVRDGAAFTAYSVAKAACAHLDRLISFQNPGRIVTLDVSPGMVRTDLTGGDLPFFRQAPDGAWKDPQRYVDVVVDFAAGRLDALDGTFVHAAVDDLAALTSRVPGTAARQFRLLPYGSDDPVA